MRQSRLLMSVAFALACGAFSCADAAESGAETDDGEYAAQVGGRSGDGKADKPGDGKDKDDEGDEARGPRRPRFPFGDGGWDRPGRGDRGRSSRDGGLGRGRDRDDDQDEDNDDDEGPGRRRPRADGGRPTRPDFPGGGRPGLPGRGPRGPLDGGVSRP